MTKYTVFSYKSEYSYFNMVISVLIKNKNNNRLFFKFYILHI